MNDDKPENHEIFLPSSNTKPDLDVSGMTMAGADGVFIIRVSWEKPQGSPDWFRAGSGWLKFDHNTGGWPSGTGTITTQKAEAQQWHWTGEYLCGRGEVPNWWLSWNDDMSFRVWGGVAQLRLSAAAVRWKVAPLGSGERASYLIPIDYPDRRLSVR
jgi:hypothetical protein